MSSESSNSTTQSTVRPDGGDGVRPRPAELLSKEPPPGTRSDGQSASAIGRQPLSEDARRIDALYRMTDRLYHALSEKDVYESALQAIVTGLDCDRASILLYDDQQVMRFVAWKGLSESYRDAVEGHSPWTPEVRNPEPACIQDFATAEIDPALKATILAEGIRSAAFVPLCADGSLVGKFMSYFDEPHAFGEDEIELSLTIARQLAFTIQRRKAERDLREREERFRAFLAASSEVIYTMNADWTELRHLDGKQFVADTKGPIQAWLEKYIHPSDQSRVMEAVRRATETKGAFELEHRIIRADGSLGWVFSRALPMFDRRGEITEWFGVARDVTERKRSEEALEYQRRLYEAILTNTPDLAYVFDLDHRFIYANEGLLRMWGKSWEEAIGKNCLELGYEPWHAEMHDREIDQIVATKQPVRREVPFTGTMGRRIYDYLLVPVIGADGEVAAVAGTTRDVTEAREADRRKDEFLAMLAHELRNPLAPISNAIHMLRREKNGDPVQQEAHAIIARQTAQLRRLVDDLLEVARITTGRIQLQREWVMLSGIVESAVQSVRSLIEQQSHRLVVSVPDEPLWVYADTARLEQVLVNLLNNAAKYTLSAGRIELAASCNDEKVCISVRDTGIGIEPQLLPRVFDLFTQAERSLDRSYGGLGVGLSLVKNLVEMHGGDVEARSELGKGSEFIVRLPASRKRTAAVSAPKAEAASSARLRVLVVDDNVDAAESVAMLLRTCGHDTATAYDGSAAVEAAGEYLPDAVLLDIGLPKMNGYEVARQLRKNPELGRTMLVAMTGYGQAQDHKRSGDAGFDAHLVKPVDFPVVERTLEKLMAARDGGKPGRARSHG